MPNSRGVMEEIRRLTREGCSPKDIIQRGFNPGTVYDVRYRERKKRRKPNIGLDIMHIKEGIEEIIRLLRHLPEIQAAEDSLPPAPDSDLDS